MRTQRSPIVLLLFLLASTLAIADTDPNAEEKLRLQQQKELLEAQKALLDAQKALFDAQFPKFTGGKAGALTFGTSVDPFHATVNAQRALRLLGDRICTDKALKAAPTIVIVADEDLKAATAYRLAHRQLDVLVKAYESLAGDDKTPKTRSSPIAAGMAVPAFATALSSIADLTRLFRSDLKVSPEEVAVSENDLLSAIAACEGFAGKVKTSQTMTMKMLDEGQSTFWAAYKKAQTLRAEAEARGPVEVAELSVFDKAKIGAASKEDKAAFVKLTADTTRRAALITIHDKIETLVGGASEAKYPNLLWILRGEEVVKQFDVAKAAPGGVLLSANIVAKGGFSVVSTSIWRSDRFYSRGGVAVSYRVVDPKNQNTLSAGFVDQESDVQRVKFD
ncbi:hypothetical protein [Usitatibacter palustris]|uniref:Uncharacterized protein n=1 Tax=Usitatibacter palustris TaxID=2732487 RepID=A0A6M4HCB2_9PROT|nr:hypothetical protein [Usitatibacter palustris]QJR16705.1 hypothetical protein DSM104440_03541 [Usitatibacter palustris]